MQPSLPDDDPKPSARAAMLQQARAQYRYDVDLLPSVPLAAQVPSADRADASWLGQVAGKVVDVAINTAQVDGDVERSAPSHAAHAAMRQHVMSDAMNGMEGVFDLITERVLTGASQGPARLRSEYGRLFQHIARPPYTDDAHDDRVFAWLRVGGPNPLALHAVDRVPDHFPVTAEHFARTVSDDSLEAAQAEGRLFLCDYAGLAGLVGGTFPHGQQKYVAPAMGLFAGPPSHAPTGDLRPVAIQCGQRPGPRTPIITPADGTAWKMARVVFNTADGNQHQAVTHLARTHLVAEQLVMATRRQFAPHHPLRVLMDPHFEGTLSINDAAQARLIAPGGGVDIVLAGTIESSRAAAAAGFAAFDFAEALPARDLAQRGLDDHDRLPVHPYRDDALAIWGAIRSWVQGYLSLYYPNNAAVAGDAELQAWATEVAAPDGGRLGGFDPPRTVDSLGDTVAMVLFTASAQHAAVNFPQFDVVSWAAGFPLANFAPPPSSVVANARDLYALLPPLDIAQFQLDLGHLLGTLHHTRLGEYPRRWAGLKGWFQDPRVAAPLGRYRRELERLEGEIVRRVDGICPYHHLRPSLIPQSINI